MPHLNPMNYPRRSFVSVIRAALVVVVAEAFGGHGEMHLVLERRILALDQQPGIVGDDVAQRLDPGPFALGEILQHVGFHQILVAGMADADAHAAIVVADMRGDRAQAVVAGIAAAGFHPHFAGRQFEPRRETPRRRPASSL